MFLGESKLLTLGFRKKGSHRYVFECKEWNKQRHKEVKRIVAEVTLNQKGKVIAHKGLPTDCIGNPILFQSPKLK